MCIIFSLSIISSLRLFRSQNIQSSLLGNRNVSFRALTLTFVATQLGGTAIVGSATQALIIGPQALLYTTGLSLGFCLHALGFGQAMRKTQASTVPELFQTYYSSFPLRVFSSLITTVSIFLILTSIALSSWHFMQSMGIESRLYFYLLWAIMIGYTSLGGLNAVIRTDIIQVSFVLMIFMILSISFAFKPSLICFQAVPTLLSNIQNTSSHQFISWIVMPTIFTLIGQDMGQRCFAAHSPQTVTKATLFAALILWFAGTLPVGLALLVKQQFHLTSEFIDILRYVQSSSPILAGLFSAAVATAIISSADSLLCAIGSCLAFDIFEPLSTQLSSKQLQRLSTYSIFVVGFAAVSISVVFRDILSLVIFSYALSVALLAAPIINAVIFGAHPPLVAYSSLVLSGSLFCLGALRGWDYHDILALTASQLPFIAYRIVNLQLFNRQRGV